MNPYSYQNGDPNFNLHLEGTTKKWLRYTVDFPTAHPTHYEENNTVRGEYFQPRLAGHAPLAILIHGWGDQSIIPCKLLARALVKRGIACFILYLVFHTSRMPEVVRNRLPVLTPDEWFEGYRVSVIDVRQIVDWAGGRPEINKEQVAAVGISLGGFLSAIAMGVDKRIGAGVFIVSGGNSEKITCKSRRSDFRKQYNYSEAEYHQKLNTYARYLSEVAEKGFENVEPIMRSYLTDPMTFAYLLRGRPVLMVNASWDEAIPREAALDLWEASGKPEIAWFPATHAFIWLLYPLIRRKVSRFLTSTFGIDGR
ncbi:alpha/beta hydrolase family protein [Chloroflexota bacterium]